MNNVIYFCHDCHNPVGKILFIAEEHGKEIYLCRKCALKREGKMG